MKETEEYLNDEEEIVELTEEEEKDLTGGVGASMMVRERTHINMLIPPGQYSDSFILPNAKWPVTIYKNNCETIKGAKFSYQKKGGNVVATVNLTGNLFGGIFGDIVYAGNDGRTHSLRVKIMFNN